jgi:hypothetical protein
MMDPLLFWTALGVILVIAGQIGQFMHISAKMEGRFTALEIEMKYIKIALNNMEKRPHGHPGD